MYYKLISIRKIKKITQKQIANLIGMEQTTYSRKERGISPITIAEWERIAKALEVSVEKIVEPNNNNSQSFFNEKALSLQNVVLIKKSYEKIIKAKDEQIALLKEMLDKK